MNHANHLATFASGFLPMLRESERTGLLAALAHGGSADALAAECSLHPRATALLLDALAALGVCSRSPDDGVFRRAPAFDHALPWSQLPRFLETGEVLPMIDEQATRGANYAQVVPHLADRFADSARALAARLPLARVVLDVGAGSGVWSLAMAERGDAQRDQPRGGGCTVIGLDLPEVLPRFVERAHALGLSHRAVTLAGSWSDVAPPGPVDRVVLANVLHLETGEDACALIQRAAGFVKPGGDLVIVDAFAGMPLGVRDADVAIVIACYALHLGLRTARGAVHSLDDVRAWCARAGFDDAELVDDDELRVPQALVAHRGNR